jgi:hypothetical protein
LKYLSLCICQDDIEDWNRESAKMASVYSNAYLTIAAALAKDTSVGCFATRTPKRYVSISYTSPEGISGQVLASLCSLFHETVISMYLDMDDNPLVRRAWAMQERLLSHRILHFGRDQMCFECNRSFLDESGLRINRRHLSLPNFDGPSQEGDQERETLLRWSDLLSKYCSLDLTNSSDKLPALAGIAKIFSEKLGDQYLAGLWRKSLVKDLYWHVQGARRLSYYRAPSWSWASMDGNPNVGILSRSPGNIELLALVIDCCIELKGSNPYGEVKSGWIKLQAPLQPLFLTGHYNPGPWGKFRNKYTMVRTERGNPSGCEADFDFEFGIETTREDGSTLLSCPESVEIFALFLTKQFTPQLKQRNEDRKPGYCGLIVCPIEHGSRLMRRLGKFWMDAERMGECKYLDPSVERPIITLI